MKTIFIILLFFSLNYANIQRMCLIIGNNNGLYDEPVLKYAAKDAARFHQLFMQLGDIDPHRNYLLVNKNKQDIIEVLHEIKGRIIELKNSKIEVIFYFYYSGHADTESIHINGQRIQLERIQRFFHDLKADIKIMFLDACYSGNMLRSKGINLSNPIDIKIEDHLKVRGSAIITSSSAGELSHESDELKGSLFTHYLLSGLRGGADLNKDKSVSLIEAYQFAHIQTLKKVKRSRNVKQNPAFDLDLVGQKDINLTFTKKADATIQFIDCAGEEYSVVSPRTQEIVANISPDAGDTVTLAVPADNYLVQRKTEDFLYIANLDLTWKNSLVFSTKLLRKYPIESVVSKGRFDWQFKTYQVIFENMFRKDIPINKQWISVPRINFRYNYQSYIFQFGMGYWHDLIKGKYLDIKRKSIDINLGCSYRFYSIKKMILDFGLDIGLLNIFQEPNRKNEKNYRQIGYKPLPNSTSNVQYLGLKYNLTYLFKYDILFNAQVGLNSYFYREEGHSKIALRFPFSFGIGLKF